MVLCLYRSLHLSLFLCLSIWLSICMSVCLCLCLCLSQSLSIYMYISPYNSLSLCLTHTHTHAHTHTHRGHTVRELCYWDPDFVRRLFPLLTPFIGKLAAVCIYAWHIATLIKRELGTFRVSRCIF